MEELGVRPNVPIINMMGNVFQKLGMLDKYDKLKKKYPPPKWEYRYIKGKRIRVQAKNLYKADESTDAIANGEAQIAGEAKDIGEVVGVDAVNGNSELSCVSGELDEEYSKPSESEVDDIVFEAYAGANSL